MILGHAVVHPVQHHCRRLIHSGRNALCGHEFGRQRLAVVAQGRAAGGAAVLCHGRHHCLGRIVECRAGRPNWPPGATREIEARGLGSYIARGGGGRQFSSNRARRRGHEPVRRHHQPACSGGPCITTPSANIGLRDRVRHEQLSAAAMYRGSQGVPQARWRRTCWCSRHESGAARGADRGAARPLRIRQIDPAAPDRGSRGTERRHLHYLGQPDLGPGARHCHGVSEFRAVSLAHGVRERGARPGGAASAAHAKSASARWRPSI